MVIETLSYGFAAYQGSESGYGNTRQKAIERCLKKVFGYEVCEMCNDEMYVNGRKCKGDVHLEEN